MRRRDFITLFTSAVAWPLAARAQQPERMRHIGILLPAATDNLRFQGFVGALLQELALLGWTIGRNVRIDTRWSTTSAVDIRRYAAGIGCARTGCHRGAWFFDRRAVAAGEPQRADRVRSRRRSGR